MAKPKPTSLPTGAEMEAVDEDRDLAAAIGQGLEPLVDSPAMRRLLLRNARKSHAEIAAMTGIPVTEVAERLTTLLESKTWRDDLMEEKLLLAEMGMFMEDVRERMSRFSVDDEAWASMARVQLQAIRTMLEQLANRRKAVEGQLATLTMEQAKMFTDTVKMAHEIMIEALKTKYPDLDHGVIYAEFELALPKAIAHLESRVDG